MLDYNLSDAMGIGPTFTFEGETFTLDPIDAERQALYTHYLKGQAYQEAVNSAEFLSPADAREMLAGVRRDAIAGEFDFGGQTCLNSLYSRHGLQKLFGLALVKYPQCDEAWIARLIDRLYEAMAEVKNAGPGFKMDPKTLAVVAIEPATPALNSPS